MNKLDAVKVLAEDKTFENELKYKGDNDLEVRIKNEVFANDGNMFHYRWQYYLYSTNNI